MVARDFMAADEAVAVEQFNASGKQGCIVRWDFKPVKNEVPVEDSDKLGRDYSCIGNVVQFEPSSVEQDSRFVSFSVKVYHYIPTAAQVATDIEIDLATRYAENDRPDVDFEQYRIAIENLTNNSTE